MSRNLAKRLLKKLPDLFLLPAKGMTLDDVQRELEKINIGTPVRGIRMDVSELVMPGYSCRAPPSVRLYLDDVPDADERVPHLETVATSKMFMSYELAGLTPEGVAKAVRDLVVSLLTHEVDEFFKYDGKRIFYPHSERDVRFCNDREFRDSFRNTHGLRV